MKPFTGFLKISTLSVALLASTAIVATIAMPDVAFAKQANGNGNGNGNGGNGNGNSADKGNSGKSGADKGNSSKSKAKGSSGKSKSKSKTKQASGNPLKAIGDMFKKKSDAPKAKTVAKTKSVAKVKRVATVPTELSAPKPRGNPLARTLGVHPSELGALNAANASPNALANASPNSRVGKLAIYAGEVEASRALEAELLAAQEVLASLDAPERSGAEIDTAIADADAAKTTRLNELDGLLADLEAAGGEDAGIEAEIDNATAGIAALDDEIAALEKERSDGEAYEAAAEDVATLDEDLASQTDAQRAALEEAANKQVTDAVEAAVQSLLGIDQPAETDPGDVLEEDDIVALD